MVPCPNHPDISMKASEDVCATCKEEERRRINRESKEAARKKKIQQVTDLEKFLNPTMERKKPRNGVDTAQP